MSTTAASTTTSAAAATSTAQIARRRTRGHEKPEQHKQRLEESARQKEAGRKLLKEIRSKTKQVAKLHRRLMTKATR
jgi:hypothetical protein